MSKYEGFCWDCFDVGGACFGRPTGETLITDGSGGWFVARAITPAEAAAWFADDDVKPTDLTEPFECEHPPIPEAPSRPPVAPIDMPIVGDGATESV